MVTIANLKRLVAFRLPNCKAEVTQVNDTTAEVMIPVRTGKQGCLVDLTSPVKAGEQVFNLTKAFAA